MNTMIRFLMLSVPINITFYKIVFKTSKLLLFFVVLKEILRPPLKSPASSQIQHVLYIAAMVHIKKKMIESPPPKKGDFNGLPLVS